MGKTIKKLIELNRKERFKVQGDNREWWVYCATIREHDKEPGYWCSEYPTLNAQEGIWLSNEAMVEVIQEEHSQVPVEPTSRDITFIMPPDVQQYIKSFNLTRDARETVWGTFCYYRTGDMPENHWKIGEVPEEPLTKEGILSCGWVYETSEKWGHSWYRYNNYTLQEQKREGYWEITEDEPDISRDRYYGKIPTVQALKSLMIWLEITEQPKQE